MRGVELRPVSRAARRRRTRRAPAPARLRRAVRRLHSRRRSGLATCVVPVAHADPAAASALHFDDAQHAVAGAISSASRPPPTIVPACRVGRGLRSRVRTRCASVRQRSRLRRPATDRTRAPCVRARSRARSSRVALRPCRACARRRRRLRLRLARSAFRRAAITRETFGRAHRRRARRGDRAASRRFRRRRSACGARCSTGPVSRPASICIRSTPVSRIAGENRALDRRCTAPARQQRGMHVPAAEAAASRARVAAGSGRRRRRPDRSGCVVGETCAALRGSLSVSGCSTAIAARQARAA